MATAKTIPPTTPAINGIEIPGKLGIVVEFVLFILALTSTTTISIEKDIRFHGLLSITNQKISWFAQHYESNTFALFWTKNN